MQETLEIPEGFAGTEYWRRGEHEIEFCDGFLITDYMELTLLQVVSAGARICGARRLDLT